MSWLRERVLYWPEDWGWKKSTLGFVLLVGFVILLGGCESSSEPYSPSTLYDGEPIPMFTDTDAQRLSDGLAPFEKQHGVCFGWSLTDAATQHSSVGSGKGPGISATSCDRWAEVQVIVGYTAETSEQYDGAAITVAGSPDLSSTTAIGLADFERLGIDLDVLVDDPVAATGHAALALPLMLVERGDLEPAKETTTTPEGVATGLPPADDSDFPTGRVVTMICLGLAALGLIGGGLWMWRKDRKADAQ